MTMVLLVGGNGKSEVGVKLTGKLSAMAEEGAEGDGRGLDGREVCEGLSC